MTPQNPASIRISRLLIAGAAGLLLIAAALLVFDWPWWVGIFLFLLLAALGLGGFFLHRMWLRRREQRAAVEVCGEERAEREARAQQAKAGLRTLEEQWRSAVGTLCHSNLHKHGNPLYVLPWFLVIGASGSGKSSALEEARLSAPIPAPPSSQDQAASPQCQWRFFEHSVVIDTTGRYVLQADEERDKEEWQKLLALLVKYRRKEPLNGLVVTVAANRLLEGDEEGLRAEANAVRQRTDELMRATGIKVPVYLLVTKCDLVLGMAGFFRALPGETLDRPMGMLNAEPSRPAAAFADEALKTIKERLISLRLQLLHGAPQKNKFEMLLFPEEFGSLEEGIASFVTHAFGENPYQETPLLRGIFFGSARREGSPISRFGWAATSQSRGDNGAAESASGNTRQLFLHDFFGKVLPFDRLQLVPTRRSIQWQAFTNHLGLTTWVVLGGALCGLLSFSFLKNLMAIRDISHGFGRSTAISRAAPLELAAMERLRQEILKVEQKNRNWWIPRFGLNESIKVERGLKARFCGQFQGMILQGVDRQLAAGITAVSPAVSDEIYGEYVLHLVRRINLIKARLEEKPEALREKPRPSYLLPAGTSASVGTPDAAESFGSLYAYWLAWKDDPAELGKEAARLRSWLRQLVGLKGNLHWVAGWSDRQSRRAPVALADFWGGSLNPAGEKTVGAAYTRKGKEAIDALLRELETALGGPTPLAAQKAEFAGWYKTSAFEAWHAFAAGFDKGEERLGTPGEWQQTALKIASGRGPYFSLLNRMALELEPIAGDAAAPLWLQQVYQFEAARVSAQAQQNEMVNKAAESSRKVLSSIRKNVGQQAGAQRLEAQISADKACRDYCCALRDMTPAIDSRSQTFQLASRTFGEDPVSSTSPCYAAVSAASRLKAGIGGAAVDPVVNQLLEGPVNFLWAYLRRESAAQLQSLWEEQVLAGTVGMTDEQAIPALLGPDGLAWRFIKGPAAPFLRQSASGFGPKEVLRGKIPFEPALYNFMNKGAKTQATVVGMGRPQSFSVGIQGLPTDANPEARVRPHATRLELQCGGNAQSLVNNNYPVGKTFSWSPQACGDVVLQIEVGDQVLSRHYSGTQGFPDFLKDFSGGRRNFSGRDFPGEKGALDRMGVKSITVNYRITGSAPILQQASALSGQAPRRIARGWEK